MMTMLVTMIEMVNMLVTIFFKGGEQSSSVRDRAGPGQGWILHNVGLNLNLKYILKYVDPGFLFPFSLCPLLTDLLLRDII